MIVIGADTHKASHTLAAVVEGTGRVLAEHTVGAKRRSFDDLLRWARALGGQRVWAIEDCRHVSGALERFLLARGERVMRVPPKLMAGARKSARERGKSDAIDALAIARAPIREGLDSLPVAQLAGRERDVRLLVDHRERLVAQRTALINDLRWGLHDLWPEFEIPPRALIHASWQDRVAARLARAGQVAQVRIARDELRRIRELTRRRDDANVAQRAELRFNPASIRTRSVAMSLLDEARKLEQALVKRLKELEPLMREYDQLRKLGERLGVKYTPTPAQEAAAAAAKPAAPPTTGRGRGAKT